MIRNFLITCYRWIESFFDLVKAREELLFLFSWDIHSTWFYFMRLGLFYSKTLVLIFLSGCTSLQNTWFCFLNVRRSDHCFSGLTLSRRLVGIYLIYLNFRFFLFNFLSLCFQNFLLETSFLKVYRI